MSDLDSGPWVRRVPREDWPGRWAAARIGFRGYLWSGIGWCLVGVALPFAAVLGYATGGWVGLVLEVVLLAPVLLVLLGTVVAGIILAGPSRPGVRVFMARYGLARAVLVLRPDTRRGAKPGDLRVECLAAHPRRHGAASLFDPYLRELADRERARLRIAATPWLAPVYRRRGFVDEGRTSAGLIRMTRPARAPRALGSEPPTGGSE